MRAAGLDHLVLICEDVETTMGWWRDELGLQPIRVEEWLAGEAPFPSLRIDEGTIIDFVAGSRTGTNVAHIALHVNATAEELERRADQRGWNVLGELNRHLFGARGIGAGLFITDPDGTILELRTYAG